MDAKYNVNRARLVPLQTERVSGDDNQVRTMQWVQEALRVAMTIVPGRSLNLRAWFDSTGESAEWDLSFALGYAYHNDFPLYISETIRGFFLKTHSDHAVLAVTQAFRDRVDENE